MPCAPSILIFEHIKDNHTVLIRCRLEHIMLKYMPMLCFYYSHYYAQNSAKKWYSIQIIM